MGWAVLLRFMVQNLYEEAILPTLRWGKQSVWLAASGSRRSFRAEARTHFAAKGRRQKEEERPCRLPGLRCCWQEELPCVKRNGDKHNYNPCVPQ